MNSKETFLWIHQRLRIRGGLKQKTALLITLAKKCCLSLIEVKIWVSRLQKRRKPVQKPWKANSFHGSLIFKQMITAPDLNKDGKFLSFGTEMWKVNWSTWHERQTKKKIWVPERNRTHDLPNTGKVHCPMSYENSLRARSFYWVHIWEAFYILLGSALSKSLWIVIN